MPAVETVIRLATMCRPVRFFQDADRFHQFIEIQKRLARSHSHQISSAGRFHPHSVSIVERENNLFDNFSGSQISQQAELGCQTKVHCKGQPDCEEKQIVSRRSSGMKTVSTGKLS